MRKYQPRHGGASNGVHKPSYNTWTSMRARCNVPSHKSYKYYGGKGITVCERWNSSYVNFLEDMGEPPYQHSLDRIDNSKGYCPENCRWATKEEQAANRGPFALDGERKRYLSFTYNPDLYPKHHFTGEPMTMRQLVEHTGLNDHTLRKRIRKWKSGRLTEEMVLFDGHLPRKRGPSKKKTLPPLI